MPENIQRMLESIADQIPYMAMVAGKPKFNFAKFCESILTSIATAAMIGMLFMYVGVKVLEERFETTIEYLAKDVSRLEDRIKELKNDNQSNYDYLVGRIDNLGTPVRITP